MFGRITDHIGRKKMFMVCLGLYLCFSGLGAFSFNLWSLLVCRFVAGLGIGGEYTAINSAIDELIPSHYRGRVDIAVNGTYWLGAMIGAAASILLLNPQLLPSTSAGGSRSSSARCSAWGSSSCAAPFQRARGGS